MLVYEVTRRVTDSPRYYRSRVKRVPDGLLNLVMVSLVWFARSYPSLDREVISALCEHGIRGLVDRDL
jgi:hypothetical protein